jgi:adenylosuccinate synthase
MAVAEEAEWEVFLEMARAQEEATREVGQRPKRKRRCGVFSPVRAAT